MTVTGGGISSVEFAGGVEDVTDVEARVLVDDDDDDDDDLDLVLTRLDT